MRTRTLFGILALTLTLTGVRAAVPSPIADAAARGDSVRVQTLLRQGADVNAAQADGMTALHWAALNGDVKTANVLLTAKAKTDPLTRLGNYTPLHLASSRGHAAVVARLLGAGSNAIALTSTGVQAIHLAAQAGNADAIQPLLDRGANVNALDQTHGRTPLIFAVSENRLAAMKVLLAKGADVRATTKVIDYMQRSTSDAAARSARDREIAATTGRAPVAAPGLNDPGAGGQGRAAGGGAGANAGRATAAGRGAQAYTPDPNDPDTTAGAGRAGRGAGSGPRAPTDIETIGRQGGFTALHYAVRDGYADAAAMLLDAGLDMNKRTDGDKSSPMLIAALNGQYDIAMTLIARGANPNLPSDDGVTPLFATINNEWALRTWYPQPTAGTQQKASYLQLVEALLKAGADPNARTLSHIWYASYNTGRMGVEFTGATPFWRAAYSPRCRRDEAARALRRGPEHSDDDVRSREAPERSVGPQRGARGRAARAAIPRGERSRLRHLTCRPTTSSRTRRLDAGGEVSFEELRVDVNIRDAEGFTALHLAAARGDNEMIKYLISRGADVMAVNRAGQTTVDMANSPEQRTQPFPETIKLLEGLGAKNNHKCAACK